MGFTERAQRVDWPEQALLRAQPAKRRAPLEPEARGELQGPAALKVRAQVAWENPARERGLPRAWLALAPERWGRQQASRECRMPAWEEQLAEAGSERQVAGLARERPALPMEQW